MREDWYADDWLITQGIVRDVEARTSLYLAPAKRGENATVANRDGDLWAAKHFGPGGFVLSLWLADAASRAAVEGYWDDLLRAVSHAHRQVKWKRTLAGGGERWAMGEVLTTIEPQPVGNLGIRCALEVTVPSGRWLTDDDPMTMSTVAGVASPQTLVLPSPLGDCTAPLDSLAYTIHGPVANPEVHDITDGVGAGHWFRYTGDVPPGATLTVDAGRWTVTGTGVWGPWEGHDPAAPFIPDPAALTFDGPSFLTLPCPPPGGARTVQLVYAPDPFATDPATVQLDVTGTPQWLA